MSVRTVETPSLGEVPVFRLAALGATAVLTASYLAVLYHVVAVVGGVTVFVSVVLGAFVLAVGFAHAFDRREALATGLFLLTVGLVAYLVTIPEAYLAVMSAGRIASDMASLLTGFSVMQMTEVGAWAVSIAPGPVFLTWYFAVRREYAGAAAVGGLTLGFFVLTGDSGTAGTLLGVLAATGMLAFGTLETTGGSREQVEVLAVTFAVMILASATVTAVPGGSGSPIVPSGATAVQGDIISSDERVGVGGSIKLSPTVRFTVTADEGAYWRTGVYDRYTGSGWVRTGESERYDGGPIAETPGERRTNVQRWEVKDTVNVLPVAAEPVDVDGVPAKVTDVGGIQPVDALHEGDTYAVASEVPNVTAEQLRRAGTNYPDEVTQRYLQVPDRLPDRVATRSANVTAGAENPYEAAVLVERHLERTKAYSLDVPRANGDVADRFLFEMDRGYCVYYATTMVMMLRTQGVPARFVTGYAPGQRVAEDEWVVRGYDSHAWVEVYFPDVGWVQFDPTPGGPRVSAEENRLEQAREENVSGIDAAGSENGTWTPTTADGQNESVDNETAAAAYAPTNPSSFGQPLDAENQAVADNIPTSNLDGASPASAGTGDGIPVPAPETLLLWSVLGVGVAAAVRRTELLDRVYREVWLRWQPTGDPAEEIAGAYDRVEYLLGLDRRPRRPGETTREYLAAVRADERARRVAAIRERAEYAGTASAADAQEARELAAELVSERRPL